MPAPIPKKPPCLRIPWKVKVLPSSSALVSYLAHPCRDLGVELLERTVAYPSYDLMQLFFHRVLLVHRQFTVTGLSPAGALFPAWLVM